MKLIVKTMLIALLLAGCADPKQEKIDQLRMETIVLHDEVMPRMGEVSELSTQLKEARKHVSSDTTDSAIAVVAAYTEQIRLLDEAYEGMMQWMADYQPRYETEHPKDSAVNYYTTQRGLIVRVKKDIEKSIKDGNRLLEIEEK